MVLLEMNSLRGCSMVLLMTVIVTIVHCSEARGGGVSLFLLFAFSFECRAAKIDFLIFAVLDA